jgi:hypothetical protein
MALLKGTYPIFLTLDFLISRVKIDTSTWPIFDVSDFGAIPNDNQPDNNPIQKAINAAASAGKGVVSFPPGRFLINGDDYDDILRVTTSNIILKGTDNQATTLHLLNPSGKTKTDLIGTSFDDMRSVAVVSIEGNEQLTPLATFSEQTFERGTPVPNELVSLLTAPFAFTGTETHTLQRYGQKIEYLNKIRRVIDAQTIELYQPLRFTHTPDFTPTIYQYNGINNIGIEQLRLSSEWQGGYAHHKPYPISADGAEIIRSKREQDYGWVGIWATWVSSAWITDVTLDNFTQNIIISNAGFMNIEQIEIDGTGGHAGISLSMAHNILTRKVNFLGAFAHPLSVRAWSSGNVFSEIKAFDTAFDPIAKTGPFINFHGLFPFENLFENLEGFYIHSGGDLSVLPHSGIRNTFWQIKVPELVERFAYAQNEFFNTSATQVKNMYRYHPDSIVVSVYRDSAVPVLINRRAEDRVQEDIQVFSFNSNVAPVHSLHRHQINTRKLKEPAPPAKTTIVE